ncbi:MAG TPA: hypothetical protein PKX40_18250 [Spirochaetota bacterium]|nr:hypothetical protein [Spirochaetota bacterium]
MKGMARLLLAGVLLAAATVTAGAGDNREKLFIIINYSVYHCNAEIELNGIHITKTDKDNAYTVTGFSEVGMWIYPGPNSMTVTVKPLEKKIDSSGRPAIEVSLSTVQEGQMTNEGKKFMELKIPEKEGDNRLENVKSAFTRSATFKPAYVPPSGLWSRAKPAKLDDEARRQITGIIRDYHAALQKKDANAVWNLLRFASSDMMKLRHQSTDDLKTKFMRSFNEMLADKNFILLPLDADKLVMKPVADGKLVEVTDRDGREPIRTKETKDAGAYTFGVYMGYIDGKWMIAR